MKVDNILIANVKLKVSKWPWNVTECTITFIIEIRRIVYNISRIICFSYTRICNNIDFVILIS